MKNLVASPLFSVTATLLLYVLAEKLYHRRPWFLFHPVLVSVSGLMILLNVVRLDYETYMKGGRVIDFFLGPAVVALGWPLYMEWPIIRKNPLAVGLSLMAGALAGIGSASGTAWLLGAPPWAVFSLAPKSVTTPIAMDVARKIGGVPSLTAALVILTGILGAVLGPWFLRRVGVTSPTAFGLAMGAAGHGIGTARALEHGPVQGAASALAIGLTGAATALLAPVVMKLF